MTCLERNTAWVSLMKRIILKPTLDHCIETIAKKRYWALVDEYTGKIRKEGISEETETEIEALRIFLERKDLAGYRLDTEKRLRRGEAVCLVIETPRQGQIRVSIVSDDHET